MSKSKGNIVDPYYIVNKYGVDPYRYFLLREVPFGLDGGFSEEAIVGRFNSDLANDIGNLLNRTLTMVEKYFEGKAPEVNIKAGNPDFVKNADIMARALENSMKVLSFNEGLGAIWEFINKANKSIEVRAPWKLSKEGKAEELKAFIYELMESLRVVTIAVYPFMPETAGKMWAQLGLKDLEKASFDQIKIYGLITAGSAIDKGAPLFPRIKQ
jgi:methionyl-tRNA synthetase